MKVAGKHWDDATKAEIERRHFEDGEIASVISEAMGLRYCSVTRHIRVVKLQAQSGQRGYAPVLPGYRVARVTEQTNADGSLRSRSIEQKLAPGEAFAVPKGQVVKGVSALTDPDGRVIQQWVKTRQGEVDPVALAETLKRAFKGWRGAAEPIKAPPAGLDSQLTLYPLADWHIGMFAWGRETAANWDLKIAEQVIGGAARELVAQAPRSSTAIVLGGGDLIHSDSQENRTARSGHALDVDGRYPKVVQAAARLLVELVEATLERHERVIVRILKGNHDEHASVAVAYFLLAWFRNEPRVTVDDDPSLYFHHRFGKVLLAATHGHAARGPQMPEIMSHRYARDWGETLFRYAHTFHLHHKRMMATEGGGVIVETHQSPIPPDAWHFGSGFLSGRSLQAITYHRDYGEIGRNRIAILDAEQSEKELVA
jgi:hypothetical protein